MSFELARMRFLGASDAGEFGGRVFSYTPTSDSLATVIAADFFLSYFDHLAVGDIIIINHSAGRSIAEVATSLSTGVTVTDGRDGLVAVQAITGAGAVDLLSELTEFTSDGAAQALTLANGYLGQRKIIHHVADGGSGVLTPTLASGFTTITFTTIGETVLLQFTTTGWMVIGFGGLTASLPAVA